MSTTTMTHHRRHLLLILGLASALAATDSALASGLQITEQSVTGLGRAFAGGSLPNDDVSAVFYNPADMMLSKGMQAQAGMTFIGISIEADNAGSTTRLPANLGDVLTKPGTVPVFVTIPSSGLGNDDGGTDNVVPNGFFAMDINDRMRFGLGMTSPFAVSTSYSRGWVGRYHAVDSELLTVDINPSIAYRVNDSLSIGGGVSAQYVDAKLTQALFNPLSPTKDGYVEVKADGWAFGYNLGALYEFDPNTRVSFSYRSRLNHSAEGDRTITDYLPGRNGKVSTKADVTLPDWLGLAAYRRLNDQWAVMGGVRWTNWSLFKELKLEFADGTQSVTEENWEDSWSFNIGVSYDYNPEWTFRAGYVYDQTPVPSAEYRTPRIPDSNRNAIGLGFSYHPSSQLSLDFGYMYIDFASASTENTVNLIPAPAGLITDTLRLDYNGSGNLVGIQASYRF
ncbi:MAG: outer membrane protein transport protein [Candidatus Competibacteraceae bacterium]|nr:outer membrane protein transport protein [Candidatus Competibacteraceae bacterium]